MQSLRARDKYVILGVEWKPFLVEKKRSFGVVESYTAGFEGAEIKKGTMGFITIWFDKYTPIDKALYILTYLGKYLSSKIGVSAYIDIDVYRDGAKRAVLSIMYPSKRGALKSIINTLKKIAGEKEELGVTSIDFDVMYGVNRKIVYQA